MSALAGKGILVTRPREQAQGLTESLRAAGARPILFPAIEIATPSDPDRLHTVIDGLAQFDWAIFISPTAVAQALPIIKQRFPDWPSALRVAAVGPGSARALTQAGIGDVLVSQDGADSEALLDLPEFQQVSGRRIVIVRGEGGRELLAETLRTRGAQVEYAECYRRQQPTTDPAPILALWRQGKIDAVIATSGDGVRNLFAMLGEVGKGCLANTPLFVPHRRIAETAQALGLRQAIVYAAGDEGLLKTMSDWFAHEQPGN